MTDNNTLLPSGFADILPGKAAQESRTVSNLLKSFAGFGYEQVKPPMVEFETSLLSNVEENIKQQTFRIMDPDSNDMMAIRADMTTQVARIATTRLKNESRPLRLSYAGQVLRVKGAGLNKERQLSQAGTELIGVDNANSNAESVIVAVEALKNSGITDISVDISLPSLPTILKASEPLLDAISKKDKAAIMSNAEDKTELYELLVNCRNAEELNQIDLPEPAKELTERITETINIVSNAMPNLAITIDPLEHRGFEYYTGFSFAIFSTKTDDELGKGGRYTIGADAEAACGFSLSVNTILRALPEEKEKEIESVKIDTPLEEIRALQDKGHKTVFEITTSDNS